MNIPFHFPTLDIPSSFRYILTAFTSFGFGISVARRLRVRRKNKRHKIRTLTLEKLRLFLEYHTDDPAPIQIQLIQKEVFGENWYHVTIPDLDRTKGPTTWSIYTRSNISTGNYKFSCRPDSLLFTLLDDETMEPTNFCSCLLT